MSNSHTSVVTPGPRTYQVADTVEVLALRIVTLDTDNVVKHAAPGDDLLGQAENNMPAAAADRPRGNTVAVRPLTPSNGSRRVVASAAIAVGAALGVAADGKVVTGTGLGLLALSAADDDGDVIEAAPFLPSSV